MQNDAAANLAPALRERLTALVGSHDVVLFMKGTRDAPRCGFSAAVVEILDGLVDGYATVDVLSDPEVRDGIKVFSQWPTIPQLYVKGELLGGADIAKEMFASGELQKLLGVDVESVAAIELKVTITPAAVSALNAAHKNAPPQDRYLRLSVSKDFKHALGFGPARPGDVAAVCDGVEVRADAASAKRATGLVIDVESAGFRLNNPNAPKSVKQISVRDLKALLDRGPVALFDVRSPGEAATARLPGARLLDDDGKLALEALAKQTPVVFHCHHGGRSQAAAEHYLSLGFSDVTNVAGGIDAWSVEIDPSVPRY